MQYMQYGTTGCVKSVHSRSFSDSFFSAFEEYLSVFSPNKEKYGPEKTPHWDTFRAVKFSKKTVDNDNKELLWLNQSSGSEKTSFWHFYAVIDLLFILCFPVFLTAFFFVLNITQNELSLQNAMIR